MKKNPSFVFITLVGLFSWAAGQELAPISLPPPQTEIGRPLMQALKVRQSSRSFSSKPLPPQELSNLLWAADGINRDDSGKRTAPSAMNWQEVDIYVLTAEGAFQYDAPLHRLLPVTKKDLRKASGTQEFVREAPVNFVYVSDRAKMDRANDEDKSLWGGADVGFIAQNVYLYCASQGLAVVVRGMIDRAVLAPALKLRTDQKIILAQTAGYPNESHHQGDTGHDSLDERTQR
ncbi:MAG TPA: nitroreductase family protein [Terriglobia bacterium]|nr:nitroreductase family protein [Terriglobia bacterium]